MVLTKTVKAAFLSLEVQAEYSLSDSKTWGSKLSLSSSIELLVVGLRPDPVISGDADLL